MSILGDAMEAVLGAIYLDGGLESARVVIERLWLNAFQDVETTSYDPKSELNEWSQGFSDELPKYEEKSRTGPVHAPVFLWKKYHSLTACLPLGWHLQKEGLNSWQQIIYSKPLTIKLKSRTFVTKVH